MSLDKGLTKAIGQLTNILEIELPKQDRLDDYVDYILSKIGETKGDLTQRELYVGKRWLEIRDQYDFVEDVLHILNENDEYLIVIDGNIVTGKWRLLNEGNGLIIENGDKKELYDLAYVNSDFLILAKHGDQLRRNNNKYWVLANEKIGAKLTWHQLMDELYNIHRGNVNYNYGVIILAVIVVLVLIFSFG